MNRSIADIQNEIVDEFALFDDWQDKYAHLIDLGRELPPIDNALKTEANKVRGCQSQVWLVAEQEDDRIRFLAESDALIVQGLIALLLRVYSNRTPDDILAADNQFLKRIGLQEHLSTNRTNGLASMMDTIRRHAALQKADVTG